MAKLPIAAFIQTRLLEFDPKFDVRSGTGFESLFFKPMQFLLQPFADEANTLEISQSFLRILQTDDPDAFDEEAVDALASNLFVTRVEGNKAAGSARVSYVDPVNREWPAGGALFTGSNGKTYTNPAPFAILASEVSAQIEDGNYYYDIPIEASEAGTDSDLAAGELVAITNDSDAVLVGNPVAIAGGNNRETNTALIERIRASIAVRDLVTGKGFNAIIFENFANFVTELQPIGFGDPEMMRDIVYNAHVGGHVDGYFKTTTIKQGSSNFIGLLTDTTRQSASSTNLELTLTDWQNVGEINLDRSNDHDPIVQQVKPSSAATYTSPVDLSNPVDLSLAQFVKVGIDGVFKNVKVAGPTPSTTTRNQILNAINVAFGTLVAFPTGNTLLVRSPTAGLSSEVVLDDPISGTSGLLAVFGLTLGGGPYVFPGDGPITFIELTHYEFDDVNGNIRRVIGPSVLVTQVTGATTLDSPQFADPVLNVFLNVLPNDILTVLSGPDAKDYRVLTKVSDNLLILDGDFSVTAVGGSYYVRRTGIKDNESVYIQYWFNPLSIDIGPLVQLDTLGRVRGIRPGREDYTITDVAFLRINAIEIIDPVTFEPSGEFLEFGGGWGSGGWGEGGYGVGGGTDFYMVVNEPTARFSAFEDSYIVLTSGLIGLSFRVDYDYVPEVITLHNFVRSEQERVLDGDMLMKHFLPAYVSGKIEYSVDTTDSSVPTNDQLTSLVKDFISTRRAGTELEYSDIYQFIQLTTDPFSRYGTFIKPFVLTATIEDTDATTTSVTGTAKLTIPTLNPFPKDTPHPLSPRIAHWVADKIELVRLD